MKTLTLSAAVLFLFAGSLKAQELDPQAVNVPQEIIVREDANGNREVFKAAEKTNVQDAESAAIAIETYVTAKNKISSVVSEGELDRVTSTEAWYFTYARNWYGWGYGYGYGYYYGGYNYYYRPYYSYNYGYYNYYYYRCW